MKISKFLLIIYFFSLSEYTFSQSFINIMGNCDSNDTRLNYENFAFLSGNLLDTLQYTHMFSWYCGVTFDDLIDLNLQKEFFTPFNFIQYETYNYLLSNMKVHLIYSQRDSINRSNIFLIELLPDTSNNPIAYVYGSNHESVDPGEIVLTAAFLVSMDSYDSYASSYTPQELTYINVFNQNGAYLLEIRDIDRNNLLVGFKYYSPTTQTEHVKFILPNN